MNWITTNIRLPEDLYIELKIKAAKERKSVAAVIRERLHQTKKVAYNDDSEVLLKRLKALGEKIAKENKGLNLTKGLIETRYEQ